MTSPEFEYLWANKPRYVLYSIAKRTGKTEIMRRLLQEAVDTGKHVHSTTECLTGECSRG